MRFLALFATAIALPSFAAQTMAQGSAQKEGGAPVAVVELFTSQGCSSCPEADALLGRLAGRADVVALSFSVDYWDYLGWKDTLADPKFSDRQKSYKGPLGVPMVYTPMMVVNGTAHLNGSDENSVVRAIEKSVNAAAATRVAMNMSLTGDHLTIETGSASQTNGAREATLWLAVMAKNVTVPIARGENRGRSITYNNVVRELMPIGTWNGEPLSVRLDRRSFVRPGVERCAALLQQGKGGPIIGASSLRDC